MTVRIHPRPPEVERLERIEALCSRFEADWRRDGDPDARSYLEEASPDDRPALLRELLLVEWCQRERRGKQLDVEAYRHRFRDHTAVVEKAWRAWGEFGTAAKSPDSVTPSTVLPSGETIAPLGILPPGVRPSPVLPGLTDLLNLGEGGMGVVYRAWDSRLERHLALKMIHAEKLSPELRHRFQTEARALARLQHPHIVQVHGWQELPDGSPVLVMEYVPGQTLESRLAHRLTPLDAARLVAILARAVQAAHAAGIVHRDLKPANVLMAPPVAGNAGTVLDGFPKVADFGLARLQTGVEGPTLSGAVMGTPSYMAPEQARGERDVGPAADVWALGVILFRCLCGELPFVGDSVLNTLERIRTTPAPSLVERAVGVPEEMNAICLRCLEKDPTRRPSAAELAELLEGFTPVSARPAVEVPSASTETITLVPTRRRRNRGAIVVGLLVAASAVAAGVIHGLSRTSVEKQPGPAILVRAEKENLVPAELKVQLWVLHTRIVTRNGEKEETGTGTIGETTFAAAFGDGVRVQAELSAPGYAYLVAFNADGKEQLLWPVNAQEQPDETMPPPAHRVLAFPVPQSKLFYLDDDETGGLQVFAVLASRQPLLSYVEWKRQRGVLPWRKQPARGGVWIADLNGTYPRAKGQGADRGTVRNRPGMPPLTPLVQGLHRGGVEQVEMVSFPVTPKEAK